MTEFRFPPIRVTKPGEITPDSIDRSLGRGCAAASQAIHVSNRQLEDAGKPGTCNCEPVLAPASGGVPEHEPGQREILLADLDPRIDRELISVKLILQDQFDYFAPPTDPRHSDADGLLDRDNVTCVGIGVKRIQGRETNKLCVVVGVRRKAEMHDIQPRMRIPSQIWWRGKTYLTDVVEMAPAFSDFALAGAPPQLVCTPGTKKFARPVPCGVSTGNYLDPATSAGTIGCMVKLNNVGTTICFLTCNHVIARENKASIGSAVLQPGIGDLGKYPADQIGSLKDFVVLKTQPSINYVDMAVASTNSNLTSPKLNCIGTISTTYINPSVNMLLRKVGKTTNYTHGAKITLISASYPITYGLGVLKFEGVSIVNNNPTFAMGGDSGSIALKDGTYNPVGMMIAGNGQVAVLVPMSKMFATAFKSGVKLLQLMA